MQTIIRVSQPLHLPSGHLPWPPPIRQEALPGAWRNPLTLVSEGVGSSVPAAAMGFVLNTGSYTCRHDWIGYQGERELMIRGELALHPYSGLNWIPFQILPADGGTLNSKTDGLVLSCFSLTTFLSSSGILALWDFRLYFSPIICLSVYMQRWHGRIIQNPHGHSFHWLSVCCALFVLIENILKARLMCFPSM